MGVAFPFLYYLFFLFLSANIYIGDQAKGRCRNRLIKYDPTFDRDEVVVLTFNWESQGCRSSEVIVLWAQRSLDSYISTHVVIHYIYIYIYIYI